ncbi:MAG: hypothetical protein LLG01_14690 [Planctomycetaceae bacterium]|nr:hypothetical protein [Planctomycetaceae bacterium]
MNSQRTVALGVIVLSCLAANGCVFVPCPDQHAPLSALVAEHNANAAQVPLLWARAKIDLTVARGGLLVPLSTDGLLLLAKNKNPQTPPGFALIGRELGHDIFRIGSSPDEGAYYFWYQFGGSGQAVWGRTALAGAPGLDAIPLDPYQLLAVLGINELPKDGSGLPAVVMSMSSSPCAYVVSYIDRQPVSGNVLFRREAHIDWKKDQEPLRPYRIDFFAADGRRTLRADLKAYMPIAGTASAVMPTDITLTTISWGGQPASAIRRIHFSLSEMTTEDKWDRSSLLFVENLPQSIVDVVQLDKNIRTQKDQQ